ncbi:hypothetical protein C5167_023931 [Papaver somniferum]|uniref:Uncharacterized protein n=1 Tax=Papaver somniferum TaxID=3469 RepID=A0A4Y7JQ14_PAPSO|nr:hypothetical protein C5167_023931 [Papaver somniferum]
MYYVAGGGVGVEGEDESEKSKSEVNDEEDESGGDFKDRLVLQKRKHKLKGNREQHSGLLLRNIVGADVASGDAIPKKPNEENKCCFHGLCEMLKSMKQLEAEIAQLNHVVRQREEDTQCTKMMLKFGRTRFRKWSHWLLVKDVVIGHNSNQLETNAKLTREIEELHSQLKNLISLRSST